MLAMSTMCDELGIKQAYLATPTIFSNGEGSFNIFTRLKLDSLFELFTKKQCLMLYIFCNEDIVLKRIHRYQSRLWLEE